jgi:hypothetical protein
MIQLQPLELAPWLSPLLDTAAQFDIEHHGMLSNHLTHNWVCLAATGASEEDARWWQRHYLGQLAEPHPRHTGGPEPALIPDPGVMIDDASWLNYVNDSRRNYAEMLSFVRARMRRFGRSKTMQMFIPPLLPGLAGAALHPLIHIGWALEADHDDMLAEGIAYLASINQCLGVKGGLDGMDLWSPDGIDIMTASSAYLTTARDAGHGALAQLRSREPQYERRGRGSFQHRMMTFNDPDLPLGDVLDAAGPLGLAALNAELLPAVDDAAALATAAYLASDCEFYVLHGLTSLHATIVLLGHLDAVDQRRALAFWWRAAMATYVVEDLPGLDKCFDVLQTGPSSVEENFDWDDVHTRARRSLDEHVTKAVYSLWRWATSGLFSARTVSLCELAARHQVRPYRSGRVHENIWFAWR